MFHSLHEVGGLHAAARAVGGCPVYVSDAPGQHDIPLLRRLVLPDGSVLRGRLPGRPTRDCLFSDVGTDGVSALKVWNANRVGGVVGAFHIQGVAWDWRTHENAVVDASPPPVRVEVRPCDVETLRGSPQAKQGPTTAGQGAGTAGAGTAGAGTGEPRFAIWRHRGARLHIAEDANAPISFELRHREWEVLTIVPVQQALVQSATTATQQPSVQPSTAGEEVMPVRAVRWAPLGLGEMINGGGALLEAGNLTTVNTSSDHDEPGAAAPEGAADAAAAPVEAEAATPTTTAIVEAKVTCRAPGRFVAFCQPAPTRVYLKVLDADGDGGGGGGGGGGQLAVAEPLAFTHDAESGKLEVMLHGSTVELTVLWGS